MSNLNSMNKIYVSVYFALLILTVVTVAVSVFRLPLATAVTVALIIATFKATLVAGYFMHLVSERFLIYGILIFTAIFFLSMILLILAGQYSLPEGAHYVT